MVSSLAADRVPIASPVPSAARGQWPGSPSLTQLGPQTSPTPAALGQALAGNTSRPESCGHLLTLSQQVTWLLPAQASERTKKGRKKLSSFPRAALLPDLFPHKDNAQLIHSLALKPLMSVLCCGALARPWGQVHTGQAQSWLFWSWRSSHIYKPACKPQFPVYWKCNFTSRLSPFLGPALPLLSAHLEKRDFVHDCFPAPLTPQLTHQIEPTTAPRGF